MFRSMMAGSAFALSLCGAAGAAGAATVNRTDEALFVVDGQDFTFTFSGLAPSNGAGGRVVISAGGPSSAPGVDITDFPSANRPEKEFFELLLDGISQGAFSCDAADGVNVVDNVISRSNNQSCAFSNTTILSGSVLDDFLADGVLSVTLNFSKTVDAFPAQQDFVRASLSYEAAVPAVPLPASGLLLAAAMGGLALRRRR